MSWLELRLRKDEERMELFKTRFPELFVLKKCSPCCPWNVDIQELSVIKKILFCGHGLKRVIRLNGKPTLVTELWAALLFLDSQIWISYGHLLLLFSLSPFFSWLLGILRKETLGGRLKVLRMTQVLRNNSFTKGTVGKIRQKEGEKTGDKGIAFSGEKVLNGKTTPWFINSDGRGWNVPAQMDLTSSLIFSSWFLGKRRRRINN